MKAILLVVGLLAGSYALLDWAGDNPRDARKMTRKVDDAAHTVADKGKRAVDQIKQ
jgi:hypothetical protein